MKIRIVIILFALLITNISIAQALDEYKYVIIPVKYDFQKSNDQYQLNSLTKFLFEKEGFSVVYDNVELPADIANNPCAAVTVNLNNASNMFTTKLVFELTNCKNQKVLISQEGRSKEKNYKKGFQEALRNAFESVTAQNYNYSGIEKSKVVTPPIIEVVEDEGELVEVEFQEAENVQEAKKSVAINETEIEESVLESSEDYTAKKDDRDDNGNILSVPSEKKLYAQENANGFQLVNSEPNIIFQLLKSGKADMYYLRNRTGTFFKEDGKWFAEYYFGGHLIKQEFEVKW